MPPLWTMWTWPDNFRIRQVPQTPKVQPEGMFSPADRAVARIVSVSEQVRLTPAKAKAISASAA